MGWNLGAWLELVVRWAHVITGVAWIGSSFFFMWLDSHLEAPEEEPGRDRSGVEGELWMVHSGGFYQVEKKKVRPERMPSTLHWFKWEATFTWLTGFFLLVLVYYLGGGVLLVDPSVSDISVGGAVGLGLATLFGSWIVYDQLWQSPLTKVPWLAPALTAAMIAGVAWGLSGVLSGRAAYLHTGAMMGTWMAFNVWARILPAQRDLLAATKEGRPGDPAKAANAKRRSTHNNYFTLPVIFVMISNHYHHTYGHPLNWAVLLALFVAGAAVRHLFNLRRLHAGIAVLAASAGLMAMGIAATAPGEAGDDDDEAAEVTDDADRKGKRRGKKRKGKAPKVAFDATTVGSVAGAVRFDGEPPGPQEVSLTAECRSLHEGPVVIDRARVADGKVDEAFVWLSKGADQWKTPAATDTIEIDQVGCIYTPHVVGVRVRQPVAFLNSDALLHNVHVKGRRNRPFNKSMPTKGMRLERVFKKAEIMVQTKCDVHPWMSAWIGVVDHPWFAVTGADGAFALDGVPPGEYTLSAWHEALGRVDQAITVGAGGEVTTDLTLPGK